MLWITKSIFILIATMSSYISVASATDVTADPLTRNQFWVNKLGLNKAWQLSSGKNVVIASCDNGFFYAESDLKNNLLMQYARDFADSNNPYTIDDGPYAWYGTAGASLIAGVKDSRGISGIAWNARIAPLQFFNNNSNDNVDRYLALKRCLNYAANIPNIKIIITSATHSNGTVEVDSSIRDTIKEIVNEGISVVMPAGNQYRELNTERFWQTGSIIVGAVRTNDFKSSYSNFGSKVAIAAYGEGITTLTNRNASIGRFSGTHAAAAQVAGTIALMLEMNPDLKPSQVKKILKDTALRIPQNATVTGTLRSYKAVLKAAEMFRNQQ